MVKKNSNHWQPDAIAVNSPRLYLQYEAWVKPEDLLANEQLIEEDQGCFDEPSDSDGWYQVEVTADLTADNGKYFTALELLFKAQNQQANKYLGDHIFLEGIELEKEGDIPLYYVACGS